MILPQALVVYLLLGICASVARLRVIRLLFLRVDVLVSALLLGFPWLFLPVIARAISIFCSTVVGIFVFTATLVTPAVVIATIISLLPVCVLILLISGSWIGNVLLSAVRLLLLLAVFVGVLLILIIPPLAAVFVISSFVFSVAVAGSVVVVATVI